MALFQIAGLDTGGSLSYYKKTAADFAATVFISRYLIGLSLIFYLY